MEKSDIILKKKTTNNQTRKIKKLNTNIFCSIRFYDNTREMIHQFKTTHPLVETILVSNKPNKEVMRGKANASHYTANFLELYPNNSFAQFMASIKNKEYATNIGFDEIEIKGLYQWASNAHIKTKVVIFDWDGTLSIIEGILLPHSHYTMKDMLKMGITYYDIALYYAGTEERLNRLRQLFEYLYTQKVEVFILTNNPTAACNWRKIHEIGIGPMSRPNFFQVVKQFIPHMKEKNILCGYETECFKPDTFFNNIYLRNLYLKMEQEHARSLSL